MEHIPGYKNKAADCLSRLPFVTRKRNDNPLKDETHVNAINEVEEESTCCPLCEIELTDTKALQQEDRFQKMIAILLKDPKSKFHERDSYGYTNDGLLYHISRGNGKEYKATVVPKVLIKTVFKEMHDHFGHFGVGKTYALIKKYYCWPKVIRNMQVNVEVVLCAEGKSSKLISTNCRQQKYLLSLLLKFPLIWL